MALIDQSLVFYDAETVNADKNSTPIDFKITKPRLGTGTPFYLIVKTDVSMPGSLSANVTFRTSKTATATALTGTVSTIATVAVAANTALGERFVYAFTPNDDVERYADVRVDLTGSGSAQFTVFLTHEMPRSYVADPDAISNP